MIRISFALFLAFAAFGFLTAFILLTAPVSPPPLLTGQTCGPNLAFETDVALVSADDFVFSAGGPAC